MRRSCCSRAPCAKRWRRVEHLGRGAGTAAAAARILGFWVCTALVVGNIIGTGIFVMPAALAPYGLNAVTGWGVTALGCLFLAIVLAGLARSFSRDDGPYAYLDPRLRRSAGLPRHVVLLDLRFRWRTPPSRSASSATSARSFPALTATPGCSAVTALMLAWFFVLVNLRGARLAGGRAGPDEVLKLLPLLAVVALGAWLLVQHPGRYAQHLPPNPVLLAAGEQRADARALRDARHRVRDDPRRAGARTRDDHPRATLAGTLIAALLYCAVSVVPMLLDPAAAARRLQCTVRRAFLPRTWRPIGDVLAAFVIVSALGALNGWTLVIAELTQSLARHRGFPQVLSREMPAAPLMGTSGLRRADDPDAPDQLQ